MEDNLIVEILLKILFALLVVVVIMTIAAYTVLAERKVASWIQGRVGPNRTSLPGIGSIPVLGRFLTRMGMWQPLADGVKFLFKEDPIPGHVKKLYYCLAPAVALVPSLSTVAVVPFGAYWVNGVEHPLVLANVDIGILFILAISSLTVYGIVMAGWAANSKYPYFGSIRSSAQMISYELAMGMSVIPVLMWANGTAPSTESIMPFADLTLFGIVESQRDLWLGIWMPIPAFVFLVALFAETNRLPFDMPESETELVGGFHTEYGSFKFGLFFVGEYAAMAIGSAVFTLLFLGGWYLIPTFGFLPDWIANPWAGWGWIGSVISVFVFLGKTLTFTFLFILVRWTLPRFRYDQVMNLGWKFLVPMAVACIILYAIVIGLWDTAVHIADTPAITE